MLQQHAPLPAELRLVPRDSRRNRRGRVRFHCGPATLGRLVAAESTQVWRGWVLDLSESGAGLLLTCPLDPETHVILHLKSPSGDRLYQIRCRVAHATQQLTGEWLIGCDFTEPLTNDDLDCLL
jgi:PilZ domain